MLVIIRNVLFRVTHFVVWTFFSRIPNNTHISKKKKLLWNSTSSYEPKDGRGIGVKHQKETKSIVFWLILNPSHLILIYHQQTLKKLLQTKQKPQKFKFELEPNR